MVPTAVFLTYSFSLDVSNFLEKPKSMILYVPLWDMMFSAFKSRWTILLRCSSYINFKSTIIPLITCLMICTAYCSDNRFFSLISAWRVFPLQYSVTMTFKSSFLYTSRHLIRYGLLHWYINLGSDSANFCLIILNFKVGYALIFLKSISFMATCFLLLSFMPLYTLPFEPSPIKS